MTLLRMLAFRPATTGGSSGPAPAPARADAASPAAEPGVSASVEPAVTPQAAPPSDPAAAGEISDWNRTVVALGLRGLAGELGANTVLLGVEDDRVRLALAPENAHLGGERYRKRLEEALGEHLGRAVRVELSQEVPAGTETPADTERRHSEERRRQAEQAIADDPVVQALQERFGARVEAGSVHPADPGTGGSKH
jgi:DNA polymerase-3 subunit gamma/tau